MTWTFAVPAMADPVLGLPPLAAPPAISHSEAVSYFILNCAYFGTWNGERDPTKSKTLRIGVLGKDNLGATLDTVSRRAREAWYSDGSIVIERAQTPEALTSSHVVFVSSSEVDALGPVFGAFKGRPVLLVSEIPDFARVGGTIELRIRDERLQFDVNLDALEASNVVLSSNMKKRATAFIKGGKRVANPVGEGGPP